MHLPTAETLNHRLSSAAPWWIGLGLTGVAVTLAGGESPLLSSLALVGIGSDADIARRLREAQAASVGEPHGVDPAVVAGVVRRVHAAMYAGLIVFAWASLLHLAGDSEAATPVRYWLAADVAVAAFLAIGYTRLARRVD
ncbi:hypothetical protein [Botrimarina sp.]|uniref:hypothetical protein n=1 Tax=Botrimarina sp. TaxID=2795802 RepID=UPI0032ED5878